MFSNYTKVLWLDLETTSFNPQVASIIDISYRKEIGDAIEDIQTFKVSPLLHVDDLKYGEYDIKEFCSKYNKVRHPQDPEQLCLFSFPEQEPIFFYAKSALWHNQEIPNVADPSNWLLGSDKLSPYEAIMVLIDDLGTSDQKWVLAGHNVKFDFDVLTFWAQRVLGSHANILLDKIHKHLVLDTLTLSRWFQYSGKLKSIQASLKQIASELNIAMEDMSTKNNLLTSMEVAKKLLT